MNLENKTELVTALNQERYNDAVEMMRIEKDWDDQCIDMFVNGFDLTKCNFLIPIKDRICTTETNSLRIAIRLSAIQAWFDNHSEDE